MLYSKKSEQSMYLSVIICTYNRGKYIPLVLNSLSKQTLSADDYEVLVVNNNSPDDTAEIISSYQKENPRMPLRSFLETNPGISHARNRGVNEAKGTIIVFLDDDETTDPSFLQNVKDFFLHYPDAGISAGPVVPVFETKPPGWLSNYITRAITGAYDKGNAIKKLPPRDYPGTGHACFRKDLFAKYGAFNTELGRKGTSLLGAEDKDFFLRLMAGKESCYYVPGAKIYHHIPAEKLTDTFFKNITFAMGKSEKIRTLNLGKASYGKRLLQEAFKWAASFVLWAGYLVALQPVKGNKLIAFRWHVTRGLLT